MKILYKVHWRGVGMWFHSSLNKSVAVETNDIFLWATYVDSFTWIDCVLGIHEKALTSSESLSFEVV